MWGYGNVNGQLKQPEGVEQQSITEYDQRGTLGEGYLGQSVIRKSRLS